MFTSVVYCFTGEAICYLSTTGKSVSIDVQSCQVVYNYELLLCGSVANAIPKGSSLQILTQKPSSSREACIEVMVLLQCAILFQSVP